MICLLTKMLFRIPGLALLPQGGPRPLSVPSRMTGLGNNSEGRCSPKNFPFLSSSSSPSALHCVLNPIPIPQRKEVVQEENVWGTGGPHTVLR